MSHRTATHRTASRRTAAHRMTAAQRLRAALTATATVLVMGGCAGKEEAGWQDPFFPAKGSTPATETMYKRQFAIAAAEDGMLFPIHFDGDALNGLGQQKLGAMLAGRPVNGPLNVYLNQPREEASSGPRVATIERALGEAGLAANAFKVEVGPNPSSLRPASAGIHALTESTDGDTAAAPSVQNR